MAKLIVKQTPEVEVPVEVLAESISAIADGIRKLRSGRLNDRALFLLIQHAAPTLGGRGGQQRVSLTEIKAIFDGIDGLAATYLKKKPQRE